MKDFLNKYNYIFENNIMLEGENKYRSLRILFIKYLFLFFSILNTKISHNNIPMYSIFFVIAIIEFFKPIVFNNKRLYYSLLLINTFFTSSVLLYSETYIFPIIFIILGEILTTIKDSKKYIFLAIHMLCFFSFVIIFFIKSNYPADELLAPVFIYFCVLIFMILIRAQKRDRREIYILNAELKEQNLKLQEYSLKIEELTLEKERTRVAQELHDSLGHYLMAISMHLDFLEKTMDSSPEKVSMTINKTKSIVEDSISELRKTVYELKENTIDTSFNDAINSLIYNFSIGSSVEFHMNISPLIETLTPNLKDVLYKTIKESLTNGIKHGNSTSFTINIILIDNIINLTICNKGKVGTKIIMSNGLTGIKDRIESFRGTVNFSYTYSGFKIASLIPLQCPIS